MITKRLIPLLILIGCLVAHVALGGYTLAVSHEEILKSAKDAVKAFEEALQSGDPQKIQSAVHRIKSNPKAIELLEQNPVLKQRFNTTLKIASTKTGVGNVIAKTEKTNLRRIEPELLTQTSDPSGIDRSVKKNSPRQIPENSNVRVSLSDFMEQDHTSQKLTESKAEQIGREMSELRRPTYRSLPDNSQKPLEPTESAWTDVMRTFRGETEIKSSPKLAKDPEGAQYVDPKNKYIAADKVHDAPSLAEIKREAKMRMQTKAGRDSAFRGARRHAADYDVREFGVESAKGSNQQKIADLARKVQGNELAVEVLNQGDPEVRSRFIEHTKKVQNETASNLKHELAQRYKVRPEDIEVRLTSTKQVPTKPGEVPAAGHDMDFSARVKGTEVPHDILRQDLAKAYGDAVNATIDPASLGKDNVVPSSYQGSDGIGSYPGEVDKLLKHAGSRPHDPHGFSQQLGKKVYDPYASSYELAKDGKFGSAEASKYEAYRQLKKIGGKLASDRVSARGGTLDPHVQESLRIVECLGKKGPDGKPITPADIDAALRVRGETLETLTRKVESNIVGVEVLKGPGKGVPDQVRMDTFVETVKGKMELKKMEQHARASETGQFKPINPSQQKGNASLDPTKTGAFKPISGHSPLPEGGISSFQEPTMADTVSNLGRDAVEWVGKKDQALGDAIGLGDLPASAGAARRGINAAGQTAGQALLAYEGGKIAWNTGEAIAHYVTGDEEKAREKGLEAAYGGLSLGAGMVAAGTAPVATGLVAAGAGGVYSYNKTRELLETTETGRKVDKAVEDSMDSGWRAAEDLGDQLGGLLGYETEWEQEERQITNRQRSYLKALDNRQISLRDGVMVEDLMNYVKTSNPADPDYRKKMNTLIEGSAKNGMRENTSEPLFATPRTHFTDSANSFDKVRGGEEGFNPTINKHKENSDGFPEINQKDSQPLEIGTAEEKSGVFGEIGRERGRPVSHAKAHEKAVSEFANVGDPEALAAIRGAEKFRRNNPGPAAWELILQEELRKGEQRRQQMMQELSGTMSTIAQATAQSAQSLNPPKQQSSYDKSLEDAARHYGLTEDRDPYKKYRPWLNEINERKAREQENLAGHAMSSTAKTEDNMDKSGQVGMGWDACVNKFCPECAHTVTLLEVSTSDECNKCKNEKRSLISQCASGKSSGHIKPSSTFKENKTKTYSNINEGPKEYYAARRYQKQYNNYHYVIGKNEYGSLQGFQIIYGPDTFQGCERWLNKKGYWK